MHERLVESRKAEWQNRERLGDLVKQREVMKAWKAIIYIYIYIYIYRERERERESKEQIFKKRGENRRLRETFPEIVFWAQGGELSGRN
jgi:hypothetical protein